MMKKIMTLFVIFFLTQSGIYCSPVKAVAESLYIKVSFSPNKVVTPDSTLTWHGNPNQYCILSVTLMNKDHLVPLVEGFELSPNVDNEVGIPITYPIQTDFSLRVEAATPDLKSTFSEVYSFQIQAKNRDNYRIRGRILQCSDLYKKGLEGAVIETVTGASYARTESEDDGYFSLEALQKGQYKLKISHDCTSNTIEKIVWVDSETPFQEACLAVYGLPDIDLWMNKPSGSSFEKEETATVFIRSSLSCVTDLYIADQHQKKLIVSQLHIPEDQLIQYYWKIPPELPLGKYYLYLKPREANLCGKAQYLFEIRSHIRTGTIQGKIMVDGKPIQGAEVSLPLQFKETVTTNAFGFYEIQDVKTGLHTIRVRKTGFIQMDKYGVEVRNGLITEEVNLTLVEETPLLQVMPEKIFLATHERKAVSYPVSLQLDQGYCKNLSLELIGAPPTVTLSTYSIPSLLQEKRILNLLVSEATEANEYQFSIRVFNDNLSKSIDVSLVVSGLSIGTFQVMARPYKQSVSVGEKAVFQLELSKYTNFSKPITFSPLNLPDYWECTFEPMAAQPPSTVICSLNPSLSVKPGMYIIRVQAKADNHVNIISLPVEVLPPGGELLIYPVSGWQPILEPASHWELPLVFSSTKGVTENVRINVDFGPSWMKISNREIGSLDHQAKSSSLVFNPDAEVGTGGYDYAISFTYGSRNEGYQKLSGRIYVLKTDPASPTNLRAKLIEEENTIQLTWGPPAKNALDVIGYNVYKSLHYPNIESTYPMNSSLIKERTLPDLDFKAGKTYWYIVKAVYSDGTISQKSNTAEMTVYPYETVKTTFTLSKGENGTYFIGDTLPVHFLSTVPGTVSFTLLTPHLRILLFRSRIEAMQTEFFNPVVPWCEKNAQLETTFLSDKGTKQVTLSALQIRESTPGKESLSGSIWNSLYDLPLAEANIEVWEGPTSGKAVSDEFGKFTLNNLSKGNYRFLIAQDQHKLVTDEVQIPLKSGNEFVWDCAWESDSSFLFWVDSKESKTISADTPTPLYFKSQVSQDVSLSVTSEGITKTLITQLHLEKDRTQVAKVRLPEDLPAGSVSIQALSLTNQTSETITLEARRNDPEGSVYWPVRDPFGNPLTDCFVNDTHTNEWGYFYLPALPSELTITKYGFEPLTLQTNPEKTPDIRLSYLRKESLPMEQEILVSKDFTEILFHFQEQEGLSEPFSLSLFSSEKDEEGKETPLFTMDSILLFPQYRYQFVFSMLDYQTISETSRIEIATASGQKTILPVKQGNEELLSLETDPEFLFVTPHQPLSFEMDLFTQGSFRKPLQLTIENEDPDIEMRLSSQITHPGTIIKGSFLMSQPKPTRTILIRIGIWLEGRLVGQAVLCFIPSSEAPAEPVEKQWSTTLYKGTQAVFNLFFSHAGKPLNVVIPASLPVSYQISENLLQFQAAPTEAGSWKETVLITMQDNSQIQFPIEVEAIERDPWLIPSLTAVNQKNGIELSIQNLPENAQYKISRIKQLPGNPFLETGWLKEQTYSDTTVKNQTVYTYRVFAFNGRLESDWSNSVTKFRNPLSLSVNLQDNLVINKKSIEVTGSTNGTFLFINERSVRLDTRGGFRETILLSEGQNVILFLVKDDFGNQLKETRTVTVDTHPPILSLIQPNLQTMETTLSQFAIQIHTDEACILVINQQTISADYLTDWKHLLNVAMGKQTFRLVAIDKANNQSYLDLVVTRYKMILYIELAIDRALAIVNNQSVVLEAPPVIMNGRTMVPLRFIGEAFGAKVDWEASKKEINLLLDTIQLTLRIGQKTAYKNKQPLPLEAPPVIMNGRTMVPLRFIGEAFGAKVDWEAKTKEIKITLKR
ncbi:carboxypeptidase regulatory-like domain-containing protein [bacterium]|nr:carboxypeptidase regulatory-like domain-containing protein [bacterium]